MSKINYITNYNCGIYKITNLVNGKCYVGQSIKLKDRLRAHRKHNQDCLIHKAITKYGLEKFKFEILIYCEPSELNLYELLFIQTFNTQSPNGYNLDMNGSDNNRSAETRKKISDRMSSNHPMSRKVIDICGRTWENVRLCAKFFNVRSSHLSYMLNGNRLWYNFLKPLDLHYFDEHKEDYKFISLEELESLLPERHERLPLIKTEIVNKDTQGGGNPMSKKVIDKNGNIWNSLIECANELNVNRKNLGSMLNGKIPMLIRIKDLELKWFSDSKYKENPTPKEDKPTRKMKTRNRNQDYSNAKKVCDNTGRSWDSVKDCAEFFQMSTNELQKYFRGGINEPRKIKGYDLYVVNNKTEEQKSLDNSN